MREQSGEDTLNEPKSRGRTNSARKECLVRGTRPVCEVDTLRRPLAAKNPTAHNCEFQKLEFSHRDHYEPDGTEMPAIQVEAKARQQPIVQPVGSRGQYDDCKVLLDFHSSRLCVAENVSSLASAQTIAGTCISLPSDVCNLVGIRSPGHVQPRTLVL